MSILIIIILKFTDRFKLKEISGNSIRFQSGFSNFADFEQTNAYNSTPPAVA